MAKPDKPPGKPPKDASGQLAATEAVDRAALQGEVAGEGEVLPSIAKPALVWVTAPEDTTPDFDLDGDVKAGTLVTMTVGDRKIEHVVTSAELSAGAVDLGLPELSSGDYTIKAMLSEGAAVSPWSDPVSFWIEAPVVTEPGGAVLRTDGSHLLRTDGSYVLRDQGYG